MSKSHEIILLFALLVIGFSYKHVVSAASRYWVGGGSSANWNATGNTNWSETSGGANNASVPGVADDVIFDGVGTGASNSTLSASITVNSVNFTGYANTLTHNNTFTLTIDSQDGSGNALILSAGMTYTRGGTTAMLTFTGTGTSKITTNGKTVGRITFNNSGGTFQLQDDLNAIENFLLTAGTFDANTKTVSLVGNTHNLLGSITFYNLTRAGTAAKTDSMTLFSNITVSNVLTINGNSATDRVLVQSDTVGTQRTITAASVSVSNADFMDINASGT